MLIFFFIEVGELVVGHLRGPHVFAYFKSYFGNDKVRIRNLIQTLDIKTMPMKLVNFKVSSKLANL